MGIKTPAYVSSGWSRSESLRFLQSKNPRNLLCFLDQGNTSECLRALKTQLQGGGKMKKVWCKPKLIVLYRGRPEEAVLTFCKDSGGQTSANSGLSACNDAVTCPDCSTTSTT